MTTPLYDGLRASSTPSGDLVELRETLAYCKHTLRLPWEQARREALDLFPHLRPPLIDDRYDEEHWLEFLWRQLRCAYQGVPAERHCRECDALCDGELCWRCEPTAVAA